MGARLAGKVALISGAARGMGAATVRLFLEEGAHVVFGDVLADEGNRLEADLVADHGAPPARFVVLDVTSEADWARAVAFAESTFGGLDILVNNAGTSGPGRTETSTMAEWDRVLAVNLTGALLGIRTTVPAMRKRGGGSIVNVSSIYGMVGAATGPAYQASKGGLRMLSRSAAFEYATQGIRVNSVHPGLVDTPMLAPLSPEQLGVRLARTPMARYADPREVAYGLLYLASDEASFVTGAELVIDGGYTAS